MKAIVQKLLNNYFGKFISGVDRENLQFNLLTGLFKVSDISLNQTYFDSLDIPVRVSYSHIDQFQIRAPLSKFGAVTCIISDLFVILEFKEEGDKNNINDTKLKLNVMEKYAKSLFGHFVKKVNQEKDGMMKGILRNIINNLELRIKNIHVRFEEKREGTQFCFGMTLKEISFLPTDEHWNIEHNVQKSQGQSEDASRITHKKMKIEKFNLYWDQSPKVWVDEEEEEILRLMKEFIGNPSSLLFDVSTDVRVKIEDGSDQSKPLYELSILLNQFDLEVTRFQIQQFLIFIQKLTLHTQLKLMLKSKSGKIDQSYKEIFQNYIKQLVLGHNHYNAQIQTIYSQVSASKLYQWTSEKIKSVVKQEKIEEQKKKQAGGWFGWWKNSQKAEDLEEEISSLLEDDEKREGQSPFCAVQLKAPKGAFRVSLLKGSVKSYAELTYNNIEILFNLSTDSNSLSLNLCLTSLQLDLGEQQQQKTMTTNILKTDKSNDQLFLLTHNKTITSLGINSNTSIQVSKIIFTLKPQSYKKVKEIFSFGDVQKSIKDNVWTKLSELRAGEQETPIEITTRNHVSVTIASPQIILPCVRGDYYLLKIGTFNLEAQNRKYQISLNDTGFLYYDCSEGDQNPDYLISDMSVNTTIETVNDQKITNVSLPNVSMRISKNDFSRLLELFQLFNDSKSIRLRSLKHRRAEIERNKEFQSKVTLKASSGGWKNDYLILSGLFIYIYQQQNCLEESLVIPIAGLKCEREEEKLVLVKDNARYVFKYSEELDELVRLIKLGATQVELLNLFSVLSDPSSKPKQTINKLTIDIPSIQIRYNTVRPVIDILLYNFHLHSLTNSSSRDTTISLKSFQIDDLTQTYRTKSYQHFLITQGDPQIELKIHSQILKEYTSQSIELDVGRINLNWKPQIFLEIHTLLKEYSKYETKENEDVSGTNWKLALKKIHEDTELIDLNDQFERSEVSVKENKQRYSTAKQYQKNQELTIFRTIKVKSSIQMQLFHRQSNIMLGRIECINLQCQIVESSNAMFVEGSIDDLLLYQVGDFSHSQTDTENKETHLIFNKKGGQSNILQFRFASYKVDEFINSDRIVKFINISIHDFEFHYYHQYTIRLFDYFFIQILYVLTEPELVLANKNLVEQLVQGEIHEEILVLGSYEEALKKLISPFFTDIDIELKNVTVYLKPHHAQKIYFVSEIESLTITNKIYREPKRFQFSNLHSTLRKYVWEEDYLIEIASFSFKMLDELLIPPTNLTLIYNSCSNDKLIKHLFKDLTAFDQGSSIKGSIDSIHVSFTRENYLHFIKFINFNILYQDLLDHLYNHNYLITKTKKPNPISVQINISNLTFKAQHKQLNLMQLQSKDFTISYQRTEVLNKIIGICTRHISLEIDNHPILNSSSHRYTNMSLEYLIQNTNKRELSLSLDSARILSSYPTASVMLEWFKLQPWVDTVEKSFVPQMAIKLNIHNIYFALKSTYSSTLFLKGEITYESFRNQNKQSPKSISDQLRQSTISLESFYHPIGNTKCEMKIEILRCTAKDFLSEDIEQIKKRTVVNRAEVVMTSRELMKIQPVSKIAEPSTDMMIMINGLNVDFSMTDILLLKKVMEDQKLTVETEELIEGLKQAGNEVVVEKQVFNSVVVSVNESVVHLINNVGDCFVPLLRLDIDEFHLKLNYNKEILEVSALMTPVLKYYNVDLIVWEPFLENCEVSVEAKMSLGNNKKIIKCYVKNDTIITLSRLLLEEVDGIVKVINQLEDDKQLLETVEYTNSVNIFNYTGYTILLNQNKVLNDQSVSMRVPVQKPKQEESKDTLLIEGLGVSPIQDDILHIQSPKKYTMLGQNNQQISFIITPGIRDSKKYLEIKNIYQLVTKQGQRVHFPITQNKNSLKYKELALDINGLQKERQVEIGGKMYRLEQSKLSMIITEEDKYTITNYLPIPITINQLQLKVGEKVRYPQLLNLNSFKQKYKVITDKTHQYITCEGYLQCYDQSIQILSNKKSVPPERIASNGSFIKNIFILESVEKIECVRGNEKDEIPTNIGKGEVKIETKEGIFEYTTQKEVSTNDAGVQSIITVSPKYILVNSTTQPLTIKQHNRQIQLGVNERKVFNFTHPTSRDIRIKVKNMTSEPLSLDSESENFILRSEDPKQYMIMCYDLIMSNNISYINLSEQLKYRLRNQTLYEMRVFQKHNQSNKQKHFIVTKQNETYFAFDYPKHNKRIIVQISVPGGEGPPLEFMIDLDDVLFEQEISLNNQHLYLNLNYTDGFRELSLLSNRFQHILASLSLEVEVIISSIGISVIGVDGVRKELLYTHIDDISFKYEYSSNELEVTGSIQRFNVQNTRDPLALNQNIIYSKENTSNPFLKFRFQQDMDSPKVIDYFGLSIDEFVIFLTSTDIRVLKSNWEEIQRVYTPAQQQTQSILDRPIDSSNRYYIDKLEIHPLKGMLSYKSLGDDNSFVKTFANIRQSPLRVNGVYLTNVSCRNIGELADRVVKTYIQNWYVTVLPLLANISILGSPASLLSKLGTGFKQFIELPVEGFTVSPLEGGKGITRGTKSLLKNTLEGTMNSVGGISESIGSGLATLTLDPEYQKQREAILNRKSKTLMDKFKAGGESLYKGIESGMRGMIEQPLKGAEENGVAGFLLGGLKGITGLALKPLSGVLDMTSQTMQGIQSLSQKQMKQMPHHPPRVFYQGDREYRIYNKHHSKLNEKIVELNPELMDLSWIESFDISRNQMLIVTFQTLVLYEKNTKSMKTWDVKRLKEVSLSDKGVLILDQKRQKLLELSIENPKTAREVFENLKQLIS